MIRTERFRDLDKPARKGLILYDFLYCRGGAENVTLDLARGIGYADLCVAFRDRSVFTDEVLSGLHCTELGRPTDIAGLRTLTGLRAFSRHAAFIDRYDWAIFSGSNTPAAVRYRPGRLNIYYCHTLPRFVYDLREFYLADSPPWMRPLIRALIHYVQPRYEAAVQQMDCIIANSRNVQSRIRRYLGLDATVIYPPCDVAQYRWLDEGSYYLSTARLEGYKRVGLVVDAFRRMPDKRLVVASGGSQLSRLKALAEGAENIDFTGWIDQPQLKELMGRAIATIYVPHDEDFGISPIESMAAGKPVIGVASGGLLETVVDGETGTLLSPDPDVEELMSAVSWMTPSRSYSMRSACEQRARAFRRELFLDKMRALVES